MKNPLTSFRLQKKRNVNFGYRNAKDPERFKEYFVQVSVEILQPARLSQNDAMATIPETAMAIEEEMIFLK